MRRPKRGLTQFRKPDIFQFRSVSERRAGLENGESARLPRWVSKVSRHLGDFYISRGNPERSMDVVTHIRAEAGHGSYVCQDDEAGCRM